MERFRILVIDDNSDIHKDFQSILVRRQEGNDKLTQLEEGLFGNCEAPPAPEDKFDLDFALQGQEGCEKVRQAIVQDNPYAVVFVDMRMPPGWDGLKTIEHIWQADPMVQVVICSAYSDYSWAEIVQRLGCTDSLLVLKKPFDSAEVAQLANALSRKWMLARQAAMQMEELEGMVQERTAALAQANQALEHEIRERQSIETALRHAQKMEAIGTLAGGIAHDFNNILFGAMGFAEIALEEADPGGRVHHCLNQVISAHKRAARLVEQILYFSRQTEHTPQVIAIHPVIKEAMELLRSTIPSTIEIRKSIDAGCGTVMADPTRIYQVIMNLCTNASQAMAETGGTLEVSLQEVDVDPVLGAEIQAPPGKYARISVRDTGMGMDEETRHRVFEPYFTTKKAGHGNGLGLATVYGIVKNHNGAILVNSECGKGAEFAVYFPVSGGAAQDFGEDAVVPAPAQNNKHVLVVDDESQIVNMEMTVLRKMGYRVTARTDSREALEMFKTDPQGFDAVVTDQTMPHLTGTEMARQMLAIRPGLPIILITGFSATVTKQKAPDLGLVRFLEKPIQSRVLVEAVNYAVSRSALPVGGQCAA